jgi:heme exporter protein B
VLLKELRVEFRNKQTVNSFIILSVLIMAAFRFAFSVTEPPVGDVAAPILWVSIFFAGMLALSPTWKREVEQGTRDGLRVAPIAPSDVYLGKLLANLVVVFALEAVVVAVFLAFFPGTSPDWPALVAVLVLGTVGFVALGNLISAISSNLAQSEVMLPVLLVPLLLFTVVISCVGATARVFTGATVLEIGDELRFLAAFALVYIAAGYLSIEYVLEG